MMNLKLEFTVCDLERDPSEHTISFTLRPKPADWGATYGSTTSVVGFLRVTSRDIHSISNGDTVYLASARHLMPHDPANPDSQAVSYPN